MFSRIDCQFQGQSEHKNPFVLTEDAVERGKFTLAENSFHMCGLILENETCMTWLDSLRADQILCEFGILRLICATVDGLAGDSSGLISQSHSAAQRFTFLPF